MIRTRFTLTLACLVMIGVITGPLSAGTPKPLTFTYKNGQPVKKSRAGLRGHEAKLKPAAGQVYAYATFDMGPSNLMKFVDGRPQWRSDQAPPDPGKPGKVTDTVGFDLGPKDRQVVPPERPLTRTFTRHLSDDAVDLTLDLASETGGD